MPTITLNGERQQLAANQTVKTLIAHLGLAGKPVAVELNKQLVPRLKHQQTTLRDGDAVEIVTLVGGG